MGKIIYFNPVKLLCKDNSIRIQVLKRGYICIELNCEDNSKKNSLLSRLFKKNKNLVKQISLDECENLILNYFSKLCSLDLPKEYLEKIKESILQSQNFRIWFSTGSIDPNKTFTISGTCIYYLS